MRVKIDGVICEMRFAGTRWHSSVVYHVIRNGRPVSAHTFEEPLRKGQRFHTNGSDYEVLE